MRGPLEIGGHAKGCVCARDTQRMHAQRPWRHDAVQLERNSEGGVGVSVPGRRANACSVKGPKNQISLTQQQRAAHARSSGQRCSTRHRQEEQEQQENGKGNASFYDACHVTQNWNEKEPRGCVPESTQRGEAAQRKRSARKCNRAENERSQQPRQRGEPGAEEERMWRLGRGDDCPPR